MKPDLDDDALIAAVDLVGRSTHSQERTRTTGADMKVTALQHQTCHHVGALVATDGNAALLARLHDTATAAAAKDPQWQLTEMDFDQAAKLLLEDACPTCRITP